MVQIINTSVSDRRNAARKFQVKFGQLDKGNRIDALAIVLLQHAACFAPNTAIPRPILRASLVNLRPSSIELRLEIHEATKRLLSLNLLDKRKSGNLQIKSVIRQFVRKSNNHPQAELNVEKAILEKMRELNKLRYSPSFLSGLRIIYVHLISVTDNALKRKDIIAAELSTELGYILIATLRENKAIGYFQKALSILQEVLEQEDHEIPKILIILRFILGVRAEYWVQMMYYEEALEITENTLGIYHMDTGDSWNKLGDINHDMGDCCIYMSQFGQTILKNAKTHYTEAKLYYERALTIYEKVLGNNNIQTANQLYKIGYLLEKIEEFTIAKSYYERSLAIKEEILGEEKVEIINCLLNLGDILKKIGEAKDAKVYYDRALVITNKLGVKPDMYGIKMRLELMLEETK